MREHATLSAIGLRPMINYSPLSSHTPFSHVAGVLRVTSPSQLDLPHVHGLARGFLEAMFPSGPFPFVHPNCLEDALTLATQHGVPSVNIYSESGHNALSKPIIDPKGYLLQSGYDG